MNDPLSGKEDRGGKEEAGAKKSRDVDSWRKVVEKMLIYIDGGDLKHCRLNPEGIRDAVIFHYKFCPSLISQGYDKNLQLIFSNSKNLNKYQRARMHLPSSYIVAKKNQTN